MTTIGKSISGTIMEGNSNCRFTASLCLVLIPMLLLGSSSLFAQKQEKKTYEVRIKLLDGQREKGRLSFAQDHTLLLYPQFKWQIADSVLRVDPKTIEWIKVRRKGKIGRGVAIGAGLGLASGLILGFAQGDDPGADCQECWSIWALKAEQYAMAYSFILTPVGALGGALIASKSKKFEVHGNLEVYRDLLPELRMYAIEFQEEPLSGK